MNTKPSKWLYHGGMFLCFALISWFATHGNKEAKNILAFITITLVVLQLWPKNKAAMIKTYKDGHHLPEWADLIGYVAVLYPLVTLGWFWHVLAWMIIAFRDFQGRHWATHPEKGKVVLLWDKAKQEHVAQPSADHEPHESKVVNN